MRPGKKPDPDQSMTVALPGDTHRLRFGSLDWLARLLPFGLGWRKPKHFRDLLAVA